MDLFTTARDIYLTLKDDTTAIAAIRAEATALAKSIATGDGSGLEVVSSTVNGQSFTAQVDMTKRDRMRLLRLVLKQVDSGGALTRRSRARFGGGV